MSLFSSLNLARLALGAQQSAIQTVGHNIANSTTEGYARQRVQMAPTPSDDLVFARLGTGVMVQRIERVVSDHLEGNLRDTTTDLGQLTERRRVYDMVEAVFNDLGGGGLSDALARFFESLEDVANNPEDPTGRSQLIEQAESLTDSFNYLDQQVRHLREALDDDIVDTALNINRLTTTIADLNKEIVDAEGGGVNPDSANDLRDRRDAAVLELSDLMNITVIENDRGSIQVLSGNEVLVFDSRARQLRMPSTTDGDITKHELRFVDNGALLDPRAGRLRSLIEGRDEIAIDLRAGLDDLARGFLEDFNAIHAGAEGLTAHSALQSFHAVEQLDVPLNEAGLPFAVRSGRFSFQVINNGDDSRQTYTIPIDADGTSDDTTLSDLAAQINAEVGVDHPEIVARVTIDGHLEIESTNESLSFTFRDDDSGVLVATGLATMFDGSSARDIEVLSTLAANPSAFGAGYGAGVGDNRAVLDMLAIRDEGFLGPTQMTFEQYYEAFIGEIGVEGAETKELLENQQAIRTSAKNQRDALSGVSIDEESIELIQHQRAYQGAARFLNIVDRLLETLINSV